MDTLLFDLLAGDRLLLCSDGLSNYFSDLSIIANLLAKPKIVTQPDPLIQYAKEAGGADNITAVVVETLPDAEAALIPDTEERLQILKQNFLGRRLSVGRLLHLLIDRTKFNRLTRRMPRLGNALLRNLSRHLSEIIVASEAPRPIDLDDTGPLP